MSKVAQYLNEHLAGDATSAAGVRARYATDKSVLSITPELVVFPRVTNDIRKVARFAWQLAEKGHVLSLTARGSGSDTTGGAIGSGAIIDVSRHLSDILYISSRDKQKVVHAQAGASLSALQQTLKWQSLTIAGADDAHAQTVGGAIAKASRASRTGKYDTIGDMVERLEVVLANGDVIETSRVSKRDVSRKKGLQTLEGEIYRQIDGIIEDNQQLIDSLSSEHDAIGYRIEQVKQKDGSIDLTPLFIGSQGTLGIISEAVLRTDFYNENESIIVATFASMDQAHDFVDQVTSLEPQSLQLIDGELFTAARKLGKRYMFSEEPFAAALCISFDDYSDRVRDRKVKRLAKLLEKAEVQYFSSTDHKIEDFRAVRAVADSISLGAHADESFVPICDGAYVPRERQGEFIAAVHELAAKNHTHLPLVIDILQGTIHARPVLHLSRLGDKQKIFKLLVAYATLVHQYGGTVAGSYAEGRTNALASYELLDEGERTMYENIRKAFDPFGILNAGAKQASDIKLLAKNLRSEYNELP